MVREYGMVRRLSSTARRVRYGSFANTYLLDRTFYSTVKPELTTTCLF